MFHNNPGASYVRVLNVFWPIFAFESNMCRRCPFCGDILAHLRAHSSSAEHLYDDMFCWLESGIVGCGQADASLYTKMLNLFCPVFAFESNMFGRHLFWGDIQGHLGAHALIAEAV